MKHQKTTIAAAALMVAGSIVGVGGTAFATTATSNAAVHVKKFSRSERHEREEARLNQSVRDGTITESQKAAYKAELKKLRIERKADLGAKPTDAARKAERTKLAGELESWASSNNFPLAKVAPKPAS